MIRSRIPDWPGLSNDKFRYLEGLDRRVVATNDASGDVTQTAEAPAALSIDSVVTTPSTDSSPFGYTQAQADAIVTAINAVLVALTDLHAVVSALQTDAVANADVLNSAKTTLNSALAGMRNAGILERQ